MKKILFTLSLLLCCNLLLANELRENNDESSQVKKEIVTKNYNVPNLTAIKAGWTFKIEVEEGDSNEITVTAPKETIDCIIITEHNGILTFDLDFSKAKTETHIKRVFRKKTDGYSMSKGGKVLYGPIKVKMQRKRLTAVILSGSATLKTNGNFSGEKMICKLSGSSKIDNINISVKKLIINMSGASKLSLNGNYTSVESEISGASKLNLLGEIISLNSSQSGSSNLFLDTKSNSIKFELSGASKSTINGSSQEIEIDCSGASFVDASDFIAQEAEIDLSGASKVNIIVTKKLDAELSGASKLTYGGNPQRKSIEKSTASSVIKK